MALKEPVLENERANIGFFETLPEVDRGRVDFSTVRGVQFLPPLFEFSGACAGCGETPYVKLLSQLFGDRLLVANATGCSSIYGGNQPTTPWSVNSEGAARPGRIRCSRITPNSAWVPPDRRQASGVRPASCCKRWLPGQIGEDLVDDLIKAEQSPRPTFAASAAAWPN
jgi:pyruvate-ferredoxin/flavodoxin oxidoreductase